jgi:hypothetical protein
MLLRIDAQEGPREAEQPCLVGIDSRQSDERRRGAAGEATACDDAALAKLSTRLPDTGSTMCEQRRPSMVFTRS